MITRRSLLVGTLGTTSSLSCVNAVLANGRAPAWEFLKAGDVIDVIAPSSPVDQPQQRYATIRAYFEKTPFKVHIPEDLIEPTTPLDEANTIAKRAKFIHDAFESDSKAIWAIGGGA